MWAKFPKNFVKKILFLFSWAKSASDVNIKSCFRVRFVVKTKINVKLLIRMWQAPCDVTHDRPSPAKIGTLQSVFRCAKLSNLRLNDCQCHGFALVQTLFPFAYDLRSEKSVIVHHFSLLFDCGKDAAGDEKEDYFATF